MVLTMRSTTPRLRLWGIAIAHFSAIAPHLVQAQARNNCWAIAGGYIEQNPGSLISGMSSTPEVPAAIAYPSASECYAAISDTAGNLQFYAGRGRIFRANGELMAQIDEAYMNGDVTQGQLIVPHPGADHMYDLFMIDASPDSSEVLVQEARALHMVVDMAAEGGSGALVSGVTTFGRKLTERLTGTLHADGASYWVLLHEWKSDKFLAYRTDADGLDTLPVVSHAGAVHAAEYGTCEVNGNAQGEMKFSYAGDRIAITSFNGPCGSPTLQPGLAQLFDFDDAAGQVHYRMTLPTHSRAYGIEFSQDGNRLYIPGVDSAERYVDQYDLLAGDTTAIAASRTRVYAVPYDGVLNAPSPRAMELAPDGKIYVSNTGHSLDAIGQPNALGTASAYTPDAIPLGSFHIYPAHTNQIKRYHDSEFAPAHTGFLQQAPRTGPSLWPNPASSSIRVHISPHIASPRARIHDNSGRVLLDVSGQTALNGPIDVRGLANGLYTVSLLDGDQVLGATRLVVQH